MAYPNKKLRKQNISPIFDTIIKNNILKARNEKNQFSYYLGNNRGYITFGGLDNRFKLNPYENIQWAPITEQTYWTITLIDIKKYFPNVKKSDENEIVGNVLCPTGCKSIIDTGTYLIYGPSEILTVFKL